MHGLSLRSAPQEIWSIVSSHCPKSAYNVATSFMREERTYWTYFATMSLVIIMNTDDAGFLLMTQ